MNLILKYFFFLLFFSQGVIAFAQQPVQYSLYMLNKHNFNTAYAGLDNSLSITGVFRKQWVALEGSPITQNVTAHLPWSYLSSGVGINIENDILGAERNTSVELSYNYIKPIRNDGLFSIGIGGGFIQKSIDGSKLRAPDGDYEGNTINHNDNFIPSGVASGIAPTLNFGTFFKNKRTEIGISANNLLESAVSYQLGSETKIKYLRNYFFIFAYELTISEKFDLKPSILVKSDIIQTQAELSGILTYNNSIFGGASFRGYNKNTIDAVIFLAGMHVTENITVAYSYDLSLSSLKAVNKGSHEIIINYNLNKEIGGEIPAKIIYNPRFY